MPLERRRSGGESGSGCLRGRGLEGAGHRPLEQVHQADKVIHGHAPAAEDGHERLAPRHERLAVARGECRRQLIEDRGKVAQEAPQREIVIATVDRPVAGDKGLESSRGEAVAVRAEGLSGGRVTGRGAGRRTAEAGVAHEAEVYTMNL